MITVHKDSFKSIILDGGQRVDEGDNIKFVVETTKDVVTGTLMKIQGSAKERKFLILPVGKQHEELWSLHVIEEGSLEVC